MVPGNKGPDNTHTRMGSHTSCHIRCCWFGCPGETQHSSEQQYFIYLAIGIGVVPVERGRCYVLYVNKYNHSRLLTWCQSLHTPHLQLPCVYQQYEAHCTLCTLGYSHTWMLQRYRNQPWLVSSLPTETNSRFGPLILVH